MVGLALLSTRQPDSPYCSPSLERLPTFCIKPYKPRCAQRPASHAPQSSLRTNVEPLTPCSLRILGIVIGTALWSSLSRLHAYSPRRATTPAYKPDAWHSPSSHALPGTTRSRHVYCIVPWHVYATRQHTWMARICTQNQPNQQRTLRCAVAARPAARSLWRKSKRHLQGK